MKDWDGVDSIVGVGDIRKSGVVGPVGLVVVDEGIWMISGCTKMSFMVSVREVGQVDPALVSHANAVDAA